VKPRIFGIETEYGPAAKTGPSWGPTSETAFDADYFRHGSRSIYCYCGSGFWGGQRPGLAAYVRVLILT